MQPVVNLFQGKAHNVFLLLLNINMVMLLVVTSGHASTRKLIINLLQSTKSTLIFVFISEGWALFQVK